MKKAIGIAIVLGFLFGAAFAQDKPKAPPPAITSTEKLAAAALAQKITDLEDQVGQFEQEFTAAHPGWQLNVRNGQLIEIPKPPEPKPADKK